MCWFTREYLDPSRNILVDPLKDGTCLHHAYRSDVINFSNDCPFCSVKSLPHSCIYIYILCIYIYIYLFVCLFINVYNIIPKKLIATIGISAIADATRVCCLPIHSSTSRMLANQGFQGWGFPEMEVPQ